MVSYKLLAPLLVILIGVPNFLVNTQSVIPEEIGKKTTTTKVPITDTTTVAPDTTTSPSTTTSTSTTSTTTTTTTAAPDTTTTSTPAPTTKPTPVPPPKTGSWKYPEKNPCIMVTFSIRLSFNYTDNDDHTAHVEYDVPVNSSSFSVNGSCTNTTNQINMMWTEYSMQNTITVQFERNTSSSQFRMTNLEFTIHPDSTNFPNAKPDQTIDLYYSHANFGTPVGMSYHCGRAQTFNLTGSLSSDTPVGHVVLAQVQLEAFRENKSNDQFSTAKDCDAIDTPDIVPIAVGCALAALVVIVLIAYLVGRRRAQARGYLSM